MILKNNTLKNYEKKNEFLCVPIYIINEWGIVWIRYQLLLAVVVAQPSGQNFALTYIFRHFMLVLQNQSKTHHTKTYPTSVNNFMVHWIQSKTREQVRNKLNNTQY